MIINEFLCLRRSLIKELTTQAKIIRKNSKEALTLNNPEAIKEALSSVIIHPDITYSAIYTHDDKLFVELINNNNYDAVLPLIPNNHGYRFNTQYLDIFQAITLDGNPIGTVRIRSNLNKIYLPLMQYAAILAGIIAFSLCFAIFLLLRSHKAIFKPILLLNQMALKIIQGDFSKRAKITSNDEIGTLAASFNKMTDILQGTTVSKDFVHNIMKSLVDTSIIITTEFTIKSINQVTCKMLGYQENELIDNPVSIILADDQFYQMILHNDFTKQGSIHYVETHYLSKKGKKVPALFSSTSVQENGTKNKSTIFTALDMTKRKQTEEQLRKLSSAREQCPASIIITDTNGNIEYVNPKFVQLTGYNAENVIGKNPRFLKSGKTPHEIYKLLWETITHGGEWQGEFYNKKKNGEFFWEQVSISPIKNNDGFISNFLAVKEDISERKKLENKLFYLADHDPLTNLFNRRRFRKELKNIIEWSNQHNSQGALLYLDLDNFKYVNDTLGQHIGDELILKLSNLLKKNMRSTNILARLGGDKFAIILPAINEFQAKSISSKILELILHNFHEVNGFQYMGISGSIGIVLFPEHGNEVDRLLNYADIAMYSAKEAGRNRFCVFSLIHRTQIKSRLTWKKRIRNALKNDQYTLHFQQILDIRKNRIIGHEALLRMIGENGECIAPNNFLSVAERFGLIRDIDRWVIQRAIHFIAEQSFAEPEHHLEVNISGKAFTDTELLPMIERELAKTRVNPTHLVFEITETAAVENMVDAQQFMDNLKTLGCRFALDDFGNGFSSFSYIKHLPANYLKIDGGFIQNLLNDETDQHLVRAMVEVAHGLEKYTIAEYVGCDRTIGLLRELGVDYAQEYHIGRPVSMPER